MRPSLLAALFLLAAPAWALAQDGAEDEAPVPAAESAAEAAPVAEPDVGDDAAEASAEGEEAAANAAATAEEGGGETEGPVEIVVHTRESLCLLIEAAAREHDIPIDFFSRLIWQESTFNPDAVSPVGAQGIAQFMPYTAVERGLADPFDPIQAIPKSAEFLRDLGADFGNLGLAAAAYNAGPQRVRSWIEGRSGLPWETRHYVETITGYIAEDWQPAVTDPGGEAEPREMLAVPSKLNCLEVAALLAKPGAAKAAVAGVKRITAPWGVQVVGNFSQSVALNAYKRLQRRHSGILAGKDPMVVRKRVPGKGPRPIYNMRVPAQSQQAAAKICSSLKAAGGSCLVMKN